MQIMLAHSSGKCSLLSHSKWLEVKPVSAATSPVTFESFRSIFFTHGLPEMLVTDNGSVFTSAEFSKFLKQNGIRHVTSHPASNGLAERAVQTFKESLRWNTEGSIDTRISRFLLQYRSTPHSTTGISPAEMLFGRRPRTILDLILPDVTKRVQLKQEQQKSNHDKQAHERSFQLEDEVYVRKFPTSKDRTSRKIVKVFGPRSFEIKLHDGSKVRQHIDHIRSRLAQVQQSDSDHSSDWIAMPDVSPADNVPVQEPEQPPEQPPPLRRSTRVSLPPVRYGHSQTA